MELPYPKPIGGHVFSILKLEIGKHFNREPAFQWPHYEEHLLGAIARQPGAEAEWLEILDLQNKEPRWRKQSVKALLEDWATCLDRARTYAARNGLARKGNPGAPKLKDVEAYARDKADGDDRWQGWAVSFHAWWSDPKRDWRRKDGKTIDWQIELAKQILEWKGGEV